ncbi:MAG: ABC transporter permease, partial [Gemmatimonadaceae bacterium]
MSPTPNPSPPKVARQLLRLFVPTHLQDAVIGDLEESYQARILSGARVSEINKWFWLETLRTPRLAFATTRPPQQHRPPNGDSTMSIVQSDVRFAARMLKRRPGFTLLAVATLALGIGATTAIFSAVNPILFESLPYPHADQLTMLWEGNSGSNRSNIGYATFADIQEQNHSFTSMAAMGSGTATMTGKGEPLYLHGQRVSPTFFSVLGVHPSFGRDFRVEDNVRGTQRVIILSNALWRNRFGGDTSVIGKPIVLDGNSVIVIGIMPANFENVVSPTSQYWMPLRYDVTLPQACRDCRHLRAIARRRADVTATRASKDIAEIFARMVAANPKLYGTTATIFTPRMDEDVVRSVRPALLAVLGAVVLVLFVACLNVMNLLLARGAQRESEFSVRAALGAGRMRIVRQLLAESMLLSILGGLSGIGVALVGVRILVAVSPSNLPRLEAIHVDAQVLAFAIIITTMVAFVFGLIPGLFATRKNLSEGIRRNGQRAVGSSRFTRSALVISEVALASVLLAGSGLLFRSMSQLFAVSPGFDAQNLLTMSIQSGAGRIRSDTLITEFYDGALRAVRQQPGVISAALTSQLPLGDEFDAYGVRFEQKPPIDAGTDGADAFRYAVSDRYFETMKIPLRSGRYFTAEDKANSPGVTVIGESFAKRHFGNASPLGQRVQVGGEKAKWR